MTEATKRYSGTPERGWTPTTVPLPGTGANLAPEDFELHERTIRLCKGLVKAYEDWLKAKKVRQS